ncbi:hypothetical protein Ga0123462_2209 [Mariprofundus ferrinatatus]|uniref:Divergent polysaccharide deacetylase n=1 Tax=Mariprofundus ferrinatatus TaxID=1921087 RepID=A0A2K8L722_9PROT|nr:divergent polysaccharide deacetylase family protein [Mariprofundus ferrinatatus]ATX83043.1 hypothetical protein Ga0123462_2209 [Mariprofundus ferrinatatus]
MSHKKMQPQWLALLFLIVLSLLLVVVSLQGTASQKRVEVPDATVKAVAPSLPEPERDALLNMEPGLQHPESGLALIMDDVGYDLAALRRILALPMPVAISIIPDAPFAHDSAEMAHAMGQLVMLHLPMEPTSEKYRNRMTPYFLNEKMDRSELRQTFLRGLTAVPYVQGVNNHMGSHLTELIEPMRWVMEVCREQGLFFVDSVTSNRSVAAEAAELAGVAWASRRIFLDHDKSPEAMQRAWQKAERCLEQEKQCIVIAHPYRSTITFLEEQLGTELMESASSVNQLLHESKPVHQAKIKPEVLL